MSERLAACVGLIVLLASACDAPADPDGGVDGGGQSDAAGPTDGSTPDGGPACGDGVVQAPEVCDGDCPTSCDDGVACTADALEGSAAACSATCAFDPITACADGDGCCPDGCDSGSDDDCSTTCGNGTVEAPETCDGDCPTSCDDGLACTTDSLVGSAASCSAACAFSPITSCVDDDGCCAPGCDATTDNDCSASCGNGVTEPPETCDGDCPSSCDDGLACTTDTLVGSAASCSASCSSAPISACTDGDGCCAPGCDSTTDDDCSPSCGNGVTEAPETCDGDCPTSCSDGIACTADALVGSAASCSAMCSFTAISACTAGDGCCPAACDATTDSDCGGPVVTGTTPTSPAIGSTFAVMGAAFTGTTTVTIGGTPQTFVEVSDTELSVTVAAATSVGAAQSLVVTNASGSSPAVMIDVLDRLAVTGAVSTSGTRVVVSFSRAVDAATVAPADFSIPGLTVSAATVSGSDVTLTTSPQLGGTTYTVTAASVDDTFGNGLTGTATAMFTGMAFSVPVTDFSMTITATSHPAGSGMYGVWYDATDSAFASDPTMTTLEGAPAMSIVDGGFTNGVYAIFASAIPATGTYQLEVRMHVIETGGALNGIRAYQIGAAVGASAVHRGPNPSAVAPLAIFGDYPGLTTGDDTAAGPVTVTTGTFSATAGDDLLIGFGTDVTTGAWNANAAAFSGAHVVVSDVILRAAP